MSATVARLGHDVRRLLLAVGVAAGVVALAACGSASAGGASERTSGPSSGPTTSSTVRLYTSVTQNTVDAVVQAFTASHPGTAVEVFRATTGQLNARIAAEQRAGGLRADVIWGTDPLSMEGYASQGLLAPWPPTVQPPAHAERTSTFAATRLLFVVMVARTDLADPPRSWADLTSPRLRGKVAIPDPALAGSALAALGWFAQTPGYGLDFFRALRANGAVQVGAVPQVVTDVAQGRHAVGITLDTEVRAAAAKGSPIRIVWPQPGAIMVYSPIARTVRATGPSADDFLGFVLSREGQQKIADTGWQPVLDTVPGPSRPPEARTVSPDWTALFGSQRTLLAEYRTIFGP